jgi:hypothetical protein
MDVLEPRKQPPRGMPYAEVSYVGRLVRAAMAAAGYA